MTILRPEELSKQTTIVTAPLQVNAPMGMPIPTPVTSQASPELVAPVLPVATPSAVVEPVAVPTPTIVEAVVTEVSKPVVNTSTNIKKAFVPLHDMLVEVMKINEDVTLASVWEDIVTKMTTASRKKVKSEVTFRDVEGTVRGIRCNYFKRFMPLEGEKAVEFAVKTTSVTGYHNSCVEGTKLRNEATRLYNADFKSIMADMMARKINQDTYIELVKTAEETRDNVPTTDLGFETKEELIAYYATAGIELIAG